MQSSDRRKSYRTAVRITAQYLLVLCIALLLPLDLMSADTEIPESVVMVLKLVSNTHVKPTTGVVISDHGLVLIADDFAGNEDEIIVLDGGTDIVRHGRPATLLHEAIPGGLAVLSVAGLERPAMLVSIADAEPGNSFRFTAFPPAQSIAQGVGPLSIPVKIYPPDRSGRISLSADASLPNVTGPIVDKCGYLVGMSLAKGVQSLENNKFPKTVLTQELLRGLAAVGIEPLTAGCTDAQRAPVDTVEIRAIPAPTEYSTEPEPESEDLVLEQAVPELAEPNGDLSGDAGPEDEAVDILPTNPVELAAPDDRESYWNWLAYLLLLALVAIGWQFLIPQRVKAVILRRVEPEETGGAHRGRISDEDEPETGPLKAGSTIAGSDQTAVAEIPALSTLPDGFNGLLIVKGSLGNDIPFQQFCMIDTAGFDVIIGRGGADLVIETPAISRAHARIKGNSPSMTLSDLGSSNGTFIRGIPCLHGEIMFIRADDEILFGDARVRIFVTGNTADVS